MEANLQLPKISSKAIFFSIYFILALLPRYALSAVTPAAAASTLCPVPSSTPTVGDSTDHVYLADGGPPSSLTQQKAGEYLEHIFNHWDSAKTKYSSFLLMLPCKLPIQEAAVDPSVDLLHKPAGSTFQYKPYVLNDHPEVLLNVAIPTELAASPVFKQDATGAFANRNIFVAIDWPSQTQPATVPPTKVRVPVEVAQVFQNAWTKGLVTRLILEEYSKFWQSNGFAPISLGSRMTAKSLPVLDGFVNVASWAPATPGTTPTNEELFKIDLKMQVANTPMVSYAMLYGWKAADELIAADTADPSLRLKSTVWKLINSRYGFSELGRMTGFTLDYLSGAVLNQNIKHLVNPANNPDAPISSPKVQDILGLLANDSEYDNSMKFLSNFQNILDAEQYAATQIHECGFFKYWFHCVHDSIKQSLITKYYYFNSGFASGIIRGTDANLLEIVNTTFEAGYTQGFREGFAAGYAAGYADGYAAGYSDAWADATITINSLNSQISSLQTQLQQAQSNQNSGGCSICNTIGGIAGDANNIITFIGTIASFF